MLTRSPQVPARSPSASPSSFHTTRASSFHYAPASPQKRSPKPPTAVTRRQSTSSPLGVTLNTKAPSQPPTPPHHRPAAPSHTQQQRDRDPPTTYVAVDAATQYSPMEPHDYSAPRHTAAASKTAPLTESALMSNHASTQRDESKPHASSSATPSSSRNEPEAGTLGPSTPSLAADDPPMLKAPHPMSPNKRRNSQGPGAVIEDAAAASDSSALPKRIKPDTAPPKVLPVRYELCDTDDIVVLIANMLSELIETNDVIAIDGAAVRAGHLTRFHSRTAPGISVLDYLHRLAKHATLIPPLLLSMVYYIDRLCAMYSDFTINTLTVHRFLITAATVAAKGLSDSFWNNSTYARVGGVKVQELKLLELEFLNKVDWKIIPDPDVLVAYYRGLVQRSPAYILEDDESLKNKDGDNKDGGAEGGDETPMDEGDDLGGDSDDLDDSDEGGGGGSSSKSQSSSKESQSKKPSTGESTDTEQPADPEI